MSAHIDLKRRASRTVIFQIPTALCACQASFAMLHIVFTNNRFAECCTGAGITLDTELAEPS